MQIPALYVPRLTHSRLRLILLGFILLISAAIDLPVRWRIGSTTFSAILTLVYAVISWSLWLFWLWIPARVWKLAWPLVAFLGWGLLSFLWYRFKTSGFQNLSVIAGFVGLIFLSAQVFKRYPESLPAFRKLLYAALWISAGLYAISVARNGLEATSLFGSRSFALYALIGLSLVLAEWRDGKWIALIYALIIALLIGASLSRMALVIAVILFPLAQFRFQKASSWIITGVGGVLAALLLVGLVIYVEPIRTRFLEGDMSLSIGNIPINAMGRTAFWSTTLQSYAESPWIGKGAGSASEVISAKYPGIEHPHSDYLRLLHDYGLVGFLLWVAGYMGILISTWRRWETATRRRLPNASLHHAAMLALLAIGLSMVTDNTLVYPFVMAPLGILVGASLGISAHE